jgi:hypothetical protein
MGGVGADAESIVYTAIEAWKIFFEASGGLKELAIPSLNWVEFGCRKFIGEDVLLCSSFITEKVSH